jgi:hypothetical protein
MSALPDPAEHQDGRDGADDLDLEDLDGLDDLDGDQEVGGAERPVVQPGDMLNVYEFQEIRHEFAAAAGLRPDQVLMTPYGYPPLPRPPAEAPDGTGKLPGELALEFAGHPVFWLDRATKRQRPDEPDDAFAIRLFLELVDRGYVNAEDGRLRNPLVANGFDVRRSDDRARLARYQAGAWDPVLCGVAIPPNPATPPGAIAREAAHVHHVHADAYQELIGVYRQTVRNALTDARNTLRDADFHVDIERLLSAGEDLRRAAVAGDDPRPWRAALDDAYRWLLARVTHLDDARVVLVIEIDRHTYLDVPRSAASYADEVEQAHAVRCAALEPYMSAIYADPADELRLRALLLAVCDAHHESLTNGREVLARAEQLIGDQFEDA